MAVYSLDQVLAVASSTGLAGDKLATAAAISGWQGSPYTGESGGNTDALGDQALANEKWGLSVGLWQIRSLNSDRGTGTPRDASRLADPEFNARAMYTLSAGGADFSPWSTYTSGRYTANLPAARAAVTGKPQSFWTALVSNTANSLLPGSGGIVTNNPVTQSAAALGTLNTILGAVTSPAFLRRVGYGAGGAALVIVGFVIVKHDSLESVGATAVKAAAL